MPQTSIKFFVAALTLTLFASCTNNPEGKIKATLDKEIGKDKIAAETKINVDKLMGKKDSKFKESLFEYFNTNTTVTYSNIKVNENKASVKLTIAKPNDEDMGGLILFAAMVDQKKLLNMTMNDLLVELSKNGRKTASIDDIRKDKYELTVELENKGEWVIANTKQLKQALSKKNKVK